MVFSPSIAVILAQRWNATGSIEARPTGGNVSPLEDHAAFLLALVPEQPDLTLNEIVAAMAKVGIVGRRTAVWRFYERHSFTLKKTLYAAEQKRVEVAHARRSWMRDQGLFNPARLMFIDETSTSTAMVRQRGRSPRGKRLIGYAPHAHWITMTFVAALRRREMTAPFVIEGAMNGPMFLAYVGQSLVPTTQARRHRRHGQSAGA